MRCARLAVLALSFVIALTSRAEGPAADAAARKLAEQELAAHGGPAAWEKARYFRFEFNVDFGERKMGPIGHFWDRYTGRYLVVTPGENGMSVWLDVNAPKDVSKAVAVTAKGERLSGEALEKALARAYGRFINDSYWLLAPLKAVDPGVHLSAEGERDFDGRKAEVLKLTFEGVGLTPGDAYWHFLDPTTKRMLGWEYVLQNTQPPATRWTWTDVADFSGLALSTTKKTADGKRIFFTNVSVNAPDVAKALVPPPAATASTSAP